MKNSKKAFTLVELLVVIAILAVLASVSIIGYTAFTKKAVENNAISELTQVKTLLEGGATADQDGYVVFFGAGEPAADEKAYSFTFNSTDNKYSFVEVTLKTTPDSSNPNEVALSEVDLKMVSEAKFATSLEFGDQTISHTVENGANKATAQWDLNTGTISIK